MKKIKKEIKDFQVAREMFGTNSKEECKLVKKLREKGVVEEWCDDWSMINFPNTDEVGWLIPNTVLE